MPHERRVYLQDHRWALLTLMITIATDDVREWGGGVSVPRGAT